MKNLRQSFLQIYNPADKPWVLDPF